MNINKLGESAFSEEIVNLRRIGGTQGKSSQGKNALSSKDTVSTSLVSDVLSKASQGVRAGLAPRSDLVARFKATIDQPVSLSDTAVAKMLRGISI